MNARKFLNGFFDNNGRVAKRMPESKRTIVHDKWDEEDYQALLVEMKELSVAEDTLIAAVETGESAMADTYLSLAKAWPSLKDDNEIRPSYMINRAVMGEAMDLKEWQELRLHTSGDPISAGLGCVTMEPELEILFDKMNEAQKMANELEQMAMEAMAMDGEMSSIEDMIAAAMAGEGNKDIEGLQDQKERIKEAMEKLKERMEAMAKEIDDEVERRIPEIKEHTKSAMKEANEQAKTMEGLGHSWGLDQGQLSKLPAQRRIELAKRISANNEKFKRIADIIGAMRRLAMSEQKKKMNHNNEEIYDIVMGNDLSSVLPTELINMNDPVLGLDFFRRYVERSLLQYNLRGEDKIAKGAIIWNEDGSGSMGGEKEVWAKAVGLALLSIAQMQERDFFAVHFGSPGEFQTFDFDTTNGGCTTMYKNTEKHFDKIDGVLEFAETFFGGGTDFVTPLSVSLDKLVAEYEAFGAVKGDIVFCTDGLCGVPEEWLEAFKAEQERLGFRVWGILLGSDNVEAEPLASICDGRVLTITDLISGEELRTLFRAV